MSNWKELLQEMRWIVGDRLNGNRTKIEELRILLKVKNNKQLKFIENFLLSFQEMTEIPNISDPDSQYFEEVCQMEENNYRLFEEQAIILQTQLSEHVQYLRNPTLPFCKQKRLLVYNIASSRYYSSFNRR